MEMYGKLHAACRKVVDIMATGKEVPWDVLQGSLLRQGELKRSEDVIPSPVLGIGNPLLIM